MPTHSGGCHCGALRFEVDEEPQGLEICDCSICTKTAYLHWYVEPENFRLVDPDAEISTYVFGTGTARHHFCPHCGISPFRRARSDPNKVDLNARCVDGLDVDAIPTRRFNGQEWEKGLQQRDD